MNEHLILLACLDKSQVLAISICLSLSHTVELQEQWLSSATWGSRRIGRAGILSLAGGLPHLLERSDNHIGCSQLFLLSLLFLQLSSAAFFESSPPQSLFLTLIKAPHSICCLNSGPFTPCRAPMVTVLSNVIQALSLTSSCLTQALAFWPSPSLLQCCCLALQLGASQFDQFPEPRFTPDHTWHITTLSSLAQCSSPPADSDPVSGDTLPSHSSLAL